MHKFCWSIVFGVTVQYYSRLSTTMYCSYGLFCWSSGDEAASSLYADTSLHERHNPDMARWLSQREGASRRYRKRRGTQLRAQEGREQKKGDGLRSLRKQMYCVSTAQVQEPKPRSECRYAGVTRFHRCGWSLHQQCASIPDQAVDTGGRPRD